MRKPFLSSAAIVQALLLLVFLSHCRKTDSYKDGLSSSGLIPRARAYVSKEIETQSAVYHTDNPRNDRTQRQKDLVWAFAYITTFRNRPAVLVPVHFVKDIFVRTTWG